LLTWIKAAFNNNATALWWSSWWESATAGHNFGRGPVLAVDDRHVTFCEYNGSVARIICVAVATLANEKHLERASDNDLLLCRKSTSNKTRYRQ
jgi:hypothetical protein